MRVYVLSEDVPRLFLMSEELVKKFYSEEGAREWRRLARDPFHRLEFDTTMLFLKKYLPSKGLVLDAGGGPGRYTIELAKLGFYVVLVDLTPKLLEIARRQIRRAKVQDKVRQIIEGSVADLSMFENNHFNVVMCLGGALSHIVDREKREKAIDELIRVAEKNTPIFVSVIGRLAVLMRGLTNFPADIEIDELYLKMSETGDYFGGYGWVPCHFYLPEELEGSFKKRNVEVLELVGLEGLATVHEKKTNRLFKKHPKAWNNWKQIHLKTCTHPSVVGVSQHFMIICRKQ